MPGAGSDGWVVRLRVPPAGDDGPEDGDLSADSSDEDLFEVSDNDADKVEDPEAAVANEPQPQDADAQDEGWGRCRPAFGDPPDALGWRRGQSRGP